MAGVRLTDITKSFGDTLVVDGVSLDIAPGEFVVLLGPSGCGKSTILRMIAGLEAPDSGEIHVGDRRIDGLPPGQRGAAMVFQSYALYPHMTVRENLAFGLRNVGVGAPEIERRIAEATRSLEIDALLDRKPGALSGGQRQRVAIARAIVKEPDIFLFDEPLSNLDAALRSRTRVELAQLHARLKATMVFVTHDQVEAMTLSDRIVVLNERRIEQIGTPTEIYHRPATRFVAGFVGSPAINVLAVTSVSEEDGRLVAELADGERVRTDIPVAGLPTTEGLTLGLRPEHVRVAHGEEAGDLACDVRLVERLGERTLVHVDLPSGEKLVAEDHGRSPVRIGDRCALIVEGRCAHLFARDGRAFHPADA